MSSGVNWRVVLFWTKIGVASIGTSLPKPLSAILLSAFASSWILGLISVAFLAIVVTIILTPGFQDVLLSLLASVLPPCLKLNKSESVECDIPLFYILSDP